jgi:hypothetical protein
VCSSDLAPGIVLALAGASGVMFTRRHPAAGEPRVSAGGDGSDSVDEG